MSQLQMKKILGCIAVEATEKMNLPNFTSDLSDDDCSSDTVESLRERLNTMKRLLAERGGSSQNSNTEEVWNRSHSTSGIIDGKFLSIAFGGALFVILSVSVYAFYHLYHAVLKKFPSRHTEL